MTVDQAYKQSDIGPIPKDWAERKLKHISPKQSVGLVINPSTYFEDNGEVPMLVGSNVRPNSIDWLRAKRISVDSNNTLTASRIYKGDIVVVRVGEPGLAAVIPEHLNGVNCASMMIIRRDSSFSSEWLAYMINSNLGKTQVEGVQYGTAQKQFNVSDAIHFIFPTPSKTEQKAIAEALSDADALIESLEQLIAKKRQIKQGAMQQLLTGRKRLPGFNKAWGNLSLDQIADIRSGGTPSTLNRDFWDGEIAWCTPTDITALRGRKYLGKTQRTITDAGLRASSAEMIPPQSIIMTTRATIGECAINTRPITTNQGFKNLIPFAADAEFLYYLMTTQKERLIQLCGGSTFLEIGTRQLRQFELTLPTDRDEQKAIAEILSNMDAEITELETRLAKARQVKQGMMQQLLTGRIRLLKPQAQPIAQADAAAI